MWVKIARDSIENGFIDTFALEMAGVGVQLKTVTQVKQEDGSWKMDTSIDLVPCAKLATVSETNEGSIIRVVKNDSDLGNGFTEPSADYPDTEELGEGSLDPEDGISPISSMPKVKPYGSDGDDTEY